MMMAKARRKRKSKAAKVTFFGHEIVLTFIGALIIGLGALFATTGLKPTFLTWIFVTVIIWLGLLVFLFPIIRKIENLM
jgi:hypothetical protein